MALTLGAGAPFVVASVASGILGGALTGGLTGGWQGALIGGGVGAIMGAGVGQWGATFLGAAVLAGGATSYATGGWEGLGDFGSGLAGGVLGGGIGYNVGNVLVSQNQPNVSLQKGAGPKPSNGNNNGKADGDPLNALDINKAGDTTDPILKDPNVRRTINEAWADSFSDDGKTVQEQGFWVKRNPSGSLATERWPAGNSGSVAIPENAPEGTIATFHTHPYAPHEPFFHGPSSGFLRGDYYVYATTPRLYGLQHYVIDKVSIMKATSYRPDGSGGFIDAIKW